MTSPVIIGAGVAACGTIVGTGVSGYVVERLRRATSREQAESEYRRASLTQLQEGLADLSLATATATF